MKFIFRDKMEKETAAVDTRFYGPARNCNELGKLGYALNGYYLVKGKDESIKEQRRSHSVSI